MGRQLALPIETKPLFLEEAFYVCDANRHVHTLLTSWPEWPASGTVYLFGEKGSGKSHLASLWQERSKPTVLSSRSLSKDYILGRDFEQKNFLLEDLEMVTDEAALFHLLNFIKDTQGTLLLTSSKTPARLPFTLPDLTSRLRSLFFLKIGAPEDDLLRALLVKRFSDLQLKIGPAVLDYILKHLTRSYEAVDHFIYSVDKLSWQEKRPLTIPFIKHVFSFVK